MVSKGKKKFHSRRIFGKRGQDNGSLKWVGRGALNKSHDFLPLMENAQKCKNADRQAGFTRVEEEERTLYTGKMEGIADF